MTTLEKYQESMRSGRYRAPVTERFSNTNQWAALPWLLVVLLLMFLAWQRIDKVETKVETVKAKSVKAAPVKRSRPKPKARPKNVKTKVAKASPRLDKEINKIAWMQKICEASRQIGLDCYNVYSSNGQLYYRK